MPFKNVTFKEWSAWVMIFALILGSAAYVFITGSIFAAGGHLVPPALPFIAFTLIVIAVSIAGHIIAAVANLSTVNDITDERDHMTARFASHWSGILLGVFVIMGLLVYAAVQDGYILFHIVFAGLVLSQVAEYGLQLFAYARSRAGADALEDA